MECFASCFPRQRRRPLLEETLINERPIYLLRERSQCELLRLCWEQDWEGVLVRIQTHPEELLVKTTQTYRTALHLATMPGASCPQNVLEAILRGNPHAAVVRDVHRFGGTPTHFVCGSHHRSHPHIIQQFVKAAQEMEAKYQMELPLDSYSPLLLACKLAAPRETIQVILATRLGDKESWIAPFTGGESCQDVYNKTKPTFFSPVQSLWVKWLAPRVLMLEEEDLMPFRTLCENILDGNANVPESTANDKCLDHWVKLLLLLKEHYKDTLVHTVASMYWAVPDLLRFVCRLYPEQCRQMSHQGEIPIHAMINSWYCGKCSSAEAQLKVLYQAFPESLLIKDVSSGLYTFARAVSCDVEVSTIYTLLREHPEVLGLQRSVL